MERLWAPWRMDYLSGSQDQACIFCAASCSGLNRERMVLLVTEYTLVMLNLYPYSNAHLLVAPRLHVARLDALSAAALQDLWQTLIFSQAVLERAVCPGGFNIGMNQGKVAGAGVEDHLHLHLVPRWEGDANFMTVIHETRVIPQDLMTTYDLLYPLFCEKEA